MRHLQLLLAICFSGITVGQTVISQVTNAASYLAYGPSRAIAQGSIIVIKGMELGPAAISIASTPFTDTTLSGTSVKFTAGSTTTNALMYYTSATQVAVLMPSNTPAGQVQVTLSYNGQTSIDFPIVVVPNAPGIFTVSLNGAGAGIITYPDYSLVSTAKADNCGGPYTTCGAANPGDVLILWATGLGPINGNDATGAGLGLNQPSPPLTVWVGNVAVTPTYRGRSGCCIGEDQIIFTVPANAPLGCAVPVTLTTQQSNGSGFTGNTVAMPIAAAGSRTCTPTIPSYTTSQVTQSIGPGPFTIGQIFFSRDDNTKDGGTGFSDTVDSLFGSFSFPPAIRPWIFSYVDAPAPGTCRIDPFPRFTDPDPPIESFRPLDIGPQLTIQAANGTKSAASNGLGRYAAVLSPDGSYFTTGSMNVSSQGGTDAPAFSLTITIPNLPKLTSPQPDATSPATVIRGNGFPVNWTGGTAGQFIFIDGVSATDAMYTFGNSFKCLVPAGPGAFTIPGTITQALLGTNFGGLRMRALTPIVPITGANFTFSSAGLQYEYYTPLKFQ